MNLVTLIILLIVIFLIIFFFLRREGYAPMVDELRHAAKKAAQVVPKLGKNINREEFFKKVYPDAELYYHTKRILHQKGNVTEEDLLGSIIS